MLKKWLKYLWLTAESSYLHSPLAPMVFKMWGPARVRAMMEREMVLMREELDEAVAEGRDMGVYEQRYLQLKWEYRREVEKGLWQDVATPGGSPERGNVND